MRALDYVLETAFDFTSGEVNDRLKKLFKAEQIDDSYAKEVGALKEAQPLPIPLSQIIIKIGATWIPIEYYEKFCHEVFEVEVKLFYSPFTHTWEIRPGDSWGMGNWDWGWVYDPSEHGDGKSFLSISKFPAIGNKMSDGLFSLALNQSSPEVRVKLSKESETETDPYFSRQAIAKQNQIKRKFDAWCREDPDRADELEAIYNAKINTTVLPNWDKAGLHLRENLLATDINPEWLHRLRDYQLDAIWRFALSGGINALEVGLGKTAVACAVVMLRRHYKTCKKALIVVQRSTLNQFYYTFREMYPKANVLCAAPEDLSQDKRQSFLAKIAYYNWDCVIMTHDSFLAVPLRNETEIEFINNQLSAVNSEISRLHLAGESSNKVSGTRGNAILKKLEKIKSASENRLKELRSWRDVGVAWENLGVDFLIVDEIQRYKNNFVQTTLSRKIAGLSIKPSGRAKDFDLKIYWLRKKLSNNALMGMTGTPEPTNSLIGIYVFQTYFQPEELTKRGIGTLDSWIANFGDIKAKPEPKVDGKWRITERLTDFINVAELAQMWFSCVHFKRYDQVKDDFDLDDKRPEPEYLTEISQMCEFQSGYMEEVGDRYQRLKNGQPILFPTRDADDYLLNKKGNRVYHPITRMPMTNLSEAIREKVGVHYVTDNYLLLSTDSRKLMLAPQLIDPEVAIDSGSKMSGVAKNVLQIYNDTKDKKSTQVVFLDMGTPGGSAKICLYEWLAKFWIDNGVPAYEIEFIQHHKKPEQKELLFYKINKGDVRILISSSESGGIGVNIQERLCAVHHADFALRPDILEQREGRAIRQGNLNNQVMVYRYITEGSNGVHGADTVLLQFLENKQKSRDRFFSGDPSLRRLSEGEEAAQLYMMLKAESTGDQRIIRYTEVEVELDEKSAELALIQSEIGRVNGRKAGSIRNSEKVIEAYKKEALTYQLDVDRIAPFRAIPGDYDIDPDDYISYCFDDLHLVVGYIGVEKKKPFLDKPKWLKELKANYHYKSFQLLPLAKAQNYILNRIKAEVLGTNYEIDKQSQFTYRRGSVPIYDLGVYQGMKVLIFPLGNEDFQFWLEGSTQWRMTFRKTGKLLLEQLDNGILTIARSLTNNNSKVDTQQKRLDKLLERKVYLDEKLTELKELVYSLDQEKNELQQVLDIDE